MPDPMRTRKRPVLERLNLRTEKTDDGCWLYLGPKTPAGHVKIGYKNKDCFVHRVAWELFRGEIPQGMLVLHLCVGRQNCWNPDHLYLGTDRDNSNDKIRQGRDRKALGEQSGVSKLTAQSVREIRGNTCGFTYAQIAEMYGVSRGTIDDVRGGRTWNHL